MAKFIMAMNVSLDGFVDHDHPDIAPDTVLFRHWIEQVSRAGSSVYGRKMYEIMRYWDDDHPEWGQDEQSFAAAWRRQHKYVVSRTLKTVGPNATLICEDVETTLRALKAKHVGEIDISGTLLAASLTDLGLIDEYRLYFHPVVLGHGTPFFARPRPPLRVLSSDRIGERVIRLSYAQA